MSSFADALIAELKLMPHPEGGHFRRVYTSMRATAEGRPVLSAIHYLLRAGECSRWHRVDADELWAHHAGDAVELFDFDPVSETVTRHVLGAPESDARATWVAAIPAHHWQAARPLGAFALMSCAVAPGFDYAGFVLLDADAAVASRLSRAHPDLASLI